jgi:hypothetical protein
LFGSKHAARMRPLGKKTNTGSSKAGSPHMCLRSSSLAFSRLRRPALVSSRAAAWLPAYFGAGAARPPRPVAAWLAGWRRSQTAPASPPPAEPLLAERDGTRLVVRFGPRQAERRARRAPGRPPEHDREAPRAHLRKARRPQQDGRGGARSASASPDGATRARPGRIRPGPEGRSGTGPYCA